MTIRGVWSKRRGLWSPTVRMFPSRFKQRQFEGVLSSVWKVSLKSKYPLNGHANGYAKNSRVRDSEPSKLGCFWPLLISLLDTFRQIIPQLIFCQESTEQLIQITRVLETLSVRQRKHPRISFQFPSIRGRYGVEYPNKETNATSNQSTNAWKHKSPDKGATSRQSSGPTGCQHFLRIFHRCCHCTNEQPISSHRTIVRRVGTGGFQRSHPQQGRKDCIEILRTWTHAHTNTLTITFQGAPSGRRFDLFQAVFYWHSRRILRIVHKSGISGALLSYGSLVVAENLFGIQ